jgi:hypothetical protein
MALSNILKEPRREITESAIGTAILVAGVYVDYKVVMWCLRDYHKDDRYAAIGFFMVVAPALMGAALFVALALPHAIGEGICNALERNGIRLRPLRRYR